MANLTLNIKQLTKARGIRRVYSHLTRFGISRHVASDLAKGRTRKMDLGVLFRLCIAFRCTVADLLVVENATEAELTHMPYLRDMLPQEEAKDLASKLEKLDNAKLKLLQEFLDGL